MKAMLSCLCSLFFITAVQATEITGNTLSYEHYINSKKRIKCLYGYAADKTGDHKAAIAIFEDCIKRWNDVYSMIWLANIYEVGVGVKQDYVYATALLKRGAHADDEAGYSSLAKYHYGVALYEGRGTAVDKEAAIKWLKKAAEEDVHDATEYLIKQGVISKETP